MILNKLNLKSYIQSCFIQFIRFSFVMNSCVMLPKVPSKASKAKPHSGVAVAKRRRQHGDRGGGMLAQLPVDLNQAPAPAPAPVSAQKRRRILKNQPAAEPAAIPPSVALAPPTVPRGNAHAQNRPQEPNDAKRARSPSPIPPIQLDLPLSFPFVLRSSSPSNKSSRSTFSAKLLASTSFMKPCVCHLSISLISSFSTTSTTSFQPPNFSYNSKFHGNESKPKSKIECYYCGEVGHIKRHCPKFKSINQQKSNYPSNYPGPKPHQGNNGHLNF